MQVNQPMIAEDELVDAYMKLMEEKMKGFAGVRKAYFKAVRKSKQILPESAERIESICRARDRITYLQILFAGNLGFQANLAHFKNPAARTFLDAGVDACLREPTMRGMEDYHAAQQAVSAALQLIPEEFNERIHAYHSYLDTVIPKLAHYKGYLMADELLRYIEPGYCRDLILTRAYQRWMKEYFETDF